MGDLTAGVALKRDALEMRRRLYAGQQAVAATMRNHAEGVTPKREAREVRQRPPFAQLNCVTDSYQGCRALTALDLTPLAQLTGAF